MSNTNKTFCLYCQKLTGNKDIKYVMQDGRKRMKSICSVCKNKKSMFVANKKNSKQSGKGIVDKFIENLPVELHLLGTYHKEPYQANDKSLTDVKPGKTLKAEFLGPGTKYDMRYARGDRGINNLDHAAMFHDLAYKSKDPAARNRADERLTDAANNFLKEPNLTFLDRIDAGIVKTAMKLIKRKV
jgi:Phospholipase A2-like domain